MHATEASINRAFLNGEKVKIIPITRLETLKQEVEQFKRHEPLNKFQRWIVDELYAFGAPDIGFSANTILLIAIPNPFYTTVAFCHRGKAYRFLCPVMSDFDATDRALDAALAPGAHRITKIENIPMKRLAVQSGFAEYGRNNICYIDGLGSHFSFAAYLSDMTCPETSWRDVRMAARCTTCTACLDSCPTHAIEAGRFLIDNEKCLSYLNESKHPFPAWLPEAAHHCVYDCLICQRVCPMNRGLKKKSGTVHFTETEIATLLSGVPCDAYPESLLKKAKHLGLHQWPDGIAKNINILMEINDRKDPAAKPQETLSHP